MEPIDDFSFKCQCVQFDDFIVVDGHLFVVSKAVCVVTTNAQFFGLNEELISWHFDLLKRERIST